MRFSDLFVVRREVDLSRVAAAEEKTVVATSSFITLQALASFPVASGILVGLWRLAGMLNPAWVGSVPVVVVLGCLLGLIIWLGTIASEDTDLDATAKVAGFFIALINGACLAMGALGLDITFLG